MKFVRLYVSPRCPHCAAMMRDLDKYKFLFPPDVQFQVILRGDMPAVPSWWHVGFRFGEYTELPAAEALRAYARGTGEKIPEDAARYAFSVPQIEVVSKVDGKTVRTVTVGWDPRNPKDSVMKLLELVLSLP